MQHNTADKDLAYNSLLSSPRWQDKRNLIIRRDAFKCRACASTSTLQVHHRQYHIDMKTGFKKNPWDYSNKYLVTLCKECHQAGHKLYNIPFFKH